MTIKKEKSLYRVSLLEDNDFAAGIVIKILKKSKDFIFLERYRNGQELLDSLYKNRPDLLILDYELPDMTALDILRSLKAKKEFTGKILILTVFEKPELLIEAMAMGANGYLLKGISPELLLSELRCILHGGSSLSASLANHILEKFFTDHVSPGIEKLSDREKQVLDLISVGYTYEMISRDLDISISTIRSYIQSIYGKLGVKNRSDAIEQWNDSGLVGRFRLFFSRAKSNGDHS